ncbi:hypothetical protein KO505_15490 [Psychrosphaera sp. F3M07]|uniref:hypothetical protein n=1 Tax=Psychrosphaera sp. F3M07 TaxID=2841560 RepID=UPI001C087C92|nr:hypothetical protein [Psychrosphaera sp. F3M07]MBU2919352.1 hypothetical protein [Psychrosphaera sp. F3M07]
MKKSTIIYFISLLIISTILFKVVTPERTAISETKVDKKVNTSQSINVSTAPISNNQDSNKLNNESEQLSSNDKQLKNTIRLLSNIYNNKTVDLKVEKSLLKYLKDTDNAEIYQVIIDNIHNANLGNESDDRLVEYSLSLLAAIDSTRSAQIFYDSISTGKWQGSNAIYTVRKSIEKLARTPNHIELVQTTFSKVSEDNPFINELAIAIAKNAKKEQIDYLIGYIDNKSVTKSNAATRAMNKIKAEPLVPHIIKYISENSSIAVQNTALSSLANMGQYEATSALITWSSKQDITSSNQVKELFTIALRRSSSTTRAIEKELSSKVFVSNDIKNVIIQLTKNDN